MKEWEAKNRKDHIIGIAFDGDELHDFGYQKFSIEENCIFYLNQKDDFSVSVRQPSLSYSVHFTTEEPIETDSFCIKVKHSAEIVQLLQKIDRQYKISTAGTSWLLSDCYRLCAVFHEICQKKYSPTDPRMVQARELLDLNFKNTDCLKECYEQSNLSRRHFDQLFKQEFYVTPARYITAKRIGLAKQLLQAPNLKIEEIAQICGFSDVYYFSKVFKQETSHTPSGYKKTRQSK